MEEKKNEKGKRRNKLQWKLYDVKPIDTDEWGGRGEKRGEKRGGETKKPEQ